MAAVSPASNPFNHLMQRKFENSLTTLMAQQLDLTPPDIIDIMADYVGDEERHFVEIEAELKELALKEDPTLFSKASSERERDYALGKFCYNKQLFNPAFILIKRAAVAGFAEAQTHMAAFYEPKHPILAYSKLDAETGPFKGANREEAERWYQMAIKQAHQEALIRHHGLHISFCTYDDLMQLEKNINRHINSPLIESLHWLSNNVKDNHHVEQRIDGLRRFVQLQINCFNPKPVVCKAYLDHLFKD